MGRKTKKDSRTNNAQRVGRSRPDANKGSTKHQEVEEGKGRVCAFTWQEEDQIAAHRPTCGLQPMRQYFRYCGHGRWICEFHSARRREPSLEAEQSWSWERTFRLPTLFGSACVPCRRQPCWDQFQPSRPVRWLTTRSAFRREGGFFETKDLQANVNGGRWEHRSRLKRPASRDAMETAMPVAGSGGQHG